MGADEDALMLEGVKWIAAGWEQPAKKKDLSQLTLTEAVEMAMGFLDVSGADPTKEQLVSFSRIWKALRNHPDLDPPEHHGSDHRRSKDTLRRVIKANHCIRRQGATKGALYFYDSSVLFEKLKLIVPIVLGEIMRTPLSYNSEITEDDLCGRLSYTDSNNVASALATLEINGAIGGFRTDSPVSGYEKIELKPGIWTFNPFGKETYNFTLSESSSEIFADIRLNLGHPDNQSKWVDMFGAIPLPEGKISKSLIVEIALWNLYHSLFHPFSTEVTAPDILRDSTATKISVETLLEDGIEIATQLGEPMSEKDQSGGVDQSALEALADDKVFKDLVAKLTLTYLKEKED